MIIECPECQAQYQYDTARFEGKSSKKIRCAKCKSIFEVLNPSAEAPPQGSTSPDETVTKRPSQPIRAAGKETAPIPEGRRYSLAILDGAGAGSVMRIERSRVTVGRSDADLVIQDGEASRYHAALELRGGSMWLEDLGSTNGTFYAGQKIEDPVELQNQSEFQIGGTTLMLIVTEVD